jgi:hypothetical protein
VAISISCNGTHLNTILVLTFVSPLLAGPVFQEKGGVLVMEAESTTADLGSWKKKTDVPDYRCNCHLEFIGKTPEADCAYPLRRWA